MRKSAAIVALVIAGAILSTTAASAKQDATYFRLRLNGSAGPLYLGMKARAARAFLRSPKYKASRNGVRCAQYVMAVGARTGLVGACFSDVRGLTAFSVNGPVFCFAPSVCTNGRDRIPLRMRRRFTRRLDRTNGVYYSYLNERIGTRKYQVVLEGPGTDPPWSMRAMGFGPCGASSMMRYYVPVRC